MEYNSKKRKSRGTESLIRKILQLLGIQRAFVQSLSGSEEEGRIRMGIHPYYNSKEIRAALLEAERRRAEAIEWQRRKIIC